MSETFAKITHKNKFLWFSQFCVNLSTAQNQQNHRISTFKSNSQNKYQLRWTVSFSNFYSLVCDLSKHSFASDIRLFVKLSIHLFLMYFLMSNVHKESDTKERGRERSVFVMSLTVIEIKSFSYSCLSKRMIF